MPGSIFAETSKGTNRLLQMGAMALTDTDDILQVFEHRGWRYSDRCGGRRRNRLR